MKSAICSIIAVLLAGSIPVHADVLFSNLSNGVQSSEQSAGAFNHYVAQAFTTGSTSIGITGATLTFDLAGQGTAGSDYTVSIYSDSTSGFASPDTNLGILTFSSTTPGNGYSEVTYTTSTPVNLELNTHYWIVAATVDSSNNVAWLLSSSTSSSSSAGVGLIGTSTSDDGGAWFLSSNGANEPFSVELAGNVVAVPEPSTWGILLCGISVLSFCGLRRKI